MRKCLFLPLGALLGASLCLGASSPAPAQTPASAPAPDSSPPPSQSTPDSAPSQSTPLASAPATDGDPASAVATVVQPTAPPPDPFAAAPPLPRLLTTFTPADVQLSHTYSGDASGGTETLTITNNKAPSADGYNVDNVASYTLTDPASGETTTTFTNWAMFRVPGQDNRLTTTVTLTMPPRWGMASGAALPPGVTGAYTGSGMVVRWRVQALDGGQSLSVPLRVVYHPPVVVPPVIVPTAGQ